MDYTVRLAEKSDLAMLPEIERAAAQLFKPYVDWLDIPLTVLESLTTPLFLLRAQKDKRLWVSAVGGQPVGFIAAKFLPDSCFIVELDVHPDYSRCGMGSALVETCCEQAQLQGFGQVILTTFRRVPWNIPFYRRLGFEVMSPDAWSPEIVAIVDHETRYGFPPEKRTVMRRVVKAQGKETAKQLMEKASAEGWTDGV